jgi:hypothetical protein
MISELGFPVGVETGEPMKKGKLGIAKLPRWLVRLPPKFARARNRCSDLRAKLISAAKVSRAGNRPFGGQAGLGLMAVKRAPRGTRKKNCRTERSLLGFNNFDRQL